MKSNDLIGPIVRFQRYNTLGRYKKFGISPVRSGYIPLTFPSKDCREELESFMNKQSKEINLKETHMTEEQLLELIETAKETVERKQELINYHAEELADEYPALIKAKKLLNALNRDLAALKAKEAKND